VAVLGFHLPPAVTLHLANLHIHLNGRIIVTTLPEGLHSVTKGLFCKVRGCQFPVKSGDYLFVDTLG
jgi:hypothetical protein